MAEALTGSTTINCAAELTVLGMRTLFHFTFKLDSSSGLYN